MSMKISSVTLDFWIDRGAAVLFLRQATYQNFGKTGYWASPRSGDIFIARRRI
jgi:hypothetical protein